MIYLIQKYAGKPLESFGRRFGLSKEGSAGLLATVANILAMFKLIKTMPPKDKVINISFAVCAAFLLGHSSLLYGELSAYIDSACHYRKINSRSNWNCFCLLAFCPKSTGAREKG